MALSRKWRRILWIGGISLLLAGSALRLFTCVKFFRGEPARAFANEIKRFAYGPVGGEADAGLPYWIWMALPRGFPYLLPAPGDSRSLGVIWEEGEELPVGFTKKTIGLPRVGDDRPLCYTEVYRSRETAASVLLIRAPAYALDVQGMVAFLVKAAADPLRPHLREARCVLAGGLIPADAFAPSVERASQMAARYG